MTRSSRRAASLLVVLLARGGLAAGFATKQPCLRTATLSSGQVVLDWNDWHEYRTYCYSDTIPLYGLERLQQGGFPYKTAWQDPGTGQTRYMEYPVVTGLLQYGVTVLTKDYLRHSGEVNPDPPEVIDYFLIMAAVLAVAWLLAVIATVPLAARPGDVALMALSPLVAVHAFTNFDTLAVALACGGMLAWARGRPVLAGLLLGLGAAAKLYPLLVLGPLLVLCWRAGKLAPWRQAAAGTAFGWLAVNLPIAVLYPRGWWEFFRLNSVRLADHDSVYYAVSVLTGWAGFDGPVAPGQSPRILNLVSFGLFAMCCAGIAWIGLTAPRRPRLASLVFLVVAAFLLTNKVWSPQYSLWLVPLAVLALPRWLPVLLWMIVDAYLWVPRLGYFLNLYVPGQGNSVQAFVTVVLVRDLLVLVLCGLVIRTVYRPGTDVVRRDRDDPAGGPLDGAPDAQRVELARIASRTYPASPGATSS